MKLQLTAWILMGLQFIAGVTSGQEQDKMLSIVNALQKGPPRQQLDAAYLLCNELRRIRLRSTTNSGFFVAFVESNYSLKILRFGSDNSLDNQ